ncbi:MAG: phytoene/squalene synthase family protein [Mucilaginibacter sp.]|jgi:phytoene/squalene synthetase
MELYDETCFECSKLITEKYSTSFSKGIKAFDKRLRYPIYGIYGFVRYADEIVDTFHDQDQQQLLGDFRKEAFEAINSGISLNPVLHAFQLTVNEHQIPIELIEAFLDSMKMDLAHKNFSEQEYLDYIHGSAEVIGLMCLKVFCEGDEVLYDRLSLAACSLGSALQKINFLRDIRSDFYERGRIYFPGIDFERFTDEVKRSIEDDIQHDLDKAHLGIKQLPKGARPGVFVAYAYYKQLFKQICKTPAVQIREKRVRVPDTQKTILYCKAVLSHGLGFL